MVCICYFIDVNYYNFNKQTITCITTEIRYTVSEQAEGKDLRKKKENKIDYLLRLDGVVCKLNTMIKQGGVKTGFGGDENKGIDRRPKIRSM